jgi:hypothetical protein
MALYPSKARILIEKRKQPIGYVLSRPDPGKMLYVPGHYETACGGCDTINGLDTIYKYVEDAAKSTADCLFEGLIVCSDYKRLVALKDAGYPVLVIGLTTPVELCLESVRMRRAEKGNDKELNPNNTQSKFKTNLRVLERFTEAGVDVVHLSREEALERIKKEFDL